MGAQITLSDTVMSGVWSVTNADATITTAGILTGAVSGLDTVLYSFRLGDVDDPEIYAAQPIYEWQQTDAGKFVMEHSVDQPVYHQHIDHMNYGYQYAITAELEKKKLAEFYLRWGKPNGNR